jgi:hypothetical protein
MTTLVSAIGLVVLLAALGGAVALDLARESDRGPGRGVFPLVLGLVVVGAACTAVRLGLLA